MDVPSALPNVETGACPMLSQYSSTVLLTYGHSIHDDETLRKISNALRSHVRSCEPELLV